MHESRQELTVMFIKALRERTPALTHSLSSFPTVG
jgi:hypothetical protein